MNIDVSRFKAGLRVYEAELLRREPPDLVIDAGANIGQYAAALRTLGYNGDVWSFEPNPDAFAVLVDRARRDTRWRAFQSALGAKPGEMRLNVSHNSVSSSLLSIGDRHTEAAPGARFVRGVDVTVSTVEAVLSESSARAVWLKLDVQGYEAAVLDGVAEAMPRIACIRMELSTAEMYAGQPDYLELLGRMREHGFTLTFAEPCFQDPRTWEMLQMEVFLRRQP